MKKLGKKLCNFTKVFLVFCLLFSNLSSLKVVFAYEGEDIPETKEEELVETPSEETTLEEEKEDEYAVEEEKQDDEEVLENKIDEENKEENLEEESEEEILEEEKEETEENKEENLDAEDTTDDSSTDTSVSESSSETSEETPAEGETAPEEGSEEAIDFTSSLNDSAEGLGFAGNYLFTDKDGEDRKLYVVLGVNETELESIVSNAYDDGTVSVSEDIVTVSTNGESATYQVVVYDNDYLDRLMKVAIGNGESNEDDDINGDGVVDAYDAATLRLILQYGFGSEVFNEDVKIDAKLEGNTESLTVGDTFTIRYIMTLADYGVNGITGLINYNKDMLSLDKVDVKNFADGSDYNGKFLYFGDYIMGDEVVTVDEETGEEIVTYSPKDYIIVEMTFTAIAGGSDAVTVSDIGYFNDVVYYSGNETISKDVTVVSNDNTLSSLTIGGVSVPIDGLTDFYTITVPNDVTSVDLSYVLSDVSASVTSIVAPEELAIGENTVTITVVAENGEERTYTITVVREGEEEEEETEVVNAVSYEDTTTYEEDNTNKEEITTGDDIEEKEETETKDESKLSRVIIIILILLAIAGLIYLIFKDDDDDETKKVNRDINKFKKEDLDTGKPNKNNNHKKTKEKGR